MAADSLVSALVTANLAGGAAIAAVLALGAPVRRLFGARAAYALWLVPPLTATASLLPARIVKVETALPPSPLSDGYLPAGSSFDWQALVLVLWAAGALLALLRLALIHARAMRGLGRMTEAGPGVLRAETNAMGPAALGVLKPRIILPADFEQRFDDRERAVVLAHERAHVAGGHVLAKAAAQVLVCLNWFNPLVHLAASRLAADQELACDEAVVLAHPTDRKAYATALLKTQTASPLPLGCCWPSPSARLLKQRVHLVGSGARGAAWRGAGLAAAGLLALGAGAAAWAVQPPRTVFVSTELQRVAAPLTPRGGFPSSVPTARQLRADAVSSPREGETIMLSHKTRLAGAALAAAISTAAPALAEPQAVTSNSQPPAAQPPAPPAPPQFVGVPNGEGAVFTTRRLVGVAPPAPDAEAGDGFLRFNCRRTPSGPDSCMVTRPDGTTQAMSVEEMDRLHAAGGPGVQRFTQIRIKPAPAE